MKKLICAIISTGILFTACGTENNEGSIYTTEDVQEITSQQETEPLRDIESIELLNNFINSAEDASIILSNIVDYEKSYYENLKSLNGTFEPELAVKHAKDWMEKKTDYKSDKIDTDFEKIGELYKKIEENNLEYEYIDKIYENYVALYSLAISPSDMSNFVSKGNEYIENIDTSIKIMKALLK